MSAENGNPEVAEALMGADNASNLKDYIDGQIAAIGKSMQQDTLGYRSGIYARKNFTVAALIAYDPEVRRLASRAGVSLRDIDAAVALASSAIIEEMNKSNPVGLKLAKTIMQVYQNGGYQ